MAKMYRLFTNWAAREGDSDQGVFEQDFPATDAGIGEIAECLLKQEVCLADDIGDLLSLDPETDIISQEVRGWLRDEVEKIAEHYDYESDIECLNNWDIVEIDDPLPDLQAENERLRATLAAVCDIAECALDRDMGDGWDDEEDQASYDKAMADVEAARSLLQEIEAKGEGG